MTETFQSSINQPPGISNDITGRNHDEAALRECEERYRAIVENSHDAILILDDQFRIIYVNDKADRVSGYSREEFLSRNFLDFLSEDSKSVIAERYRQRQQGEAPPSQYVFSYVLKNGDRRHAELKTSIFRNSVGKVWTICQMLDVTERRRMEQALKKSEERLRRITDNMEDLVIQVNLGAVVEFVSPSIKKLLDYEIADVIGRNVLDFVHSDDRDPSLTVLQHGGREGGNKLELRIRHRDGRFFWLEVVGTVVRNDDGRIVGAVLGGRDITERKKIEDDLRQSEETFRALTESTIAAIFVVQGERFRYINPAFTTLSGYTLDDLRDLHFWDLIAPEMRNFVREQGLARQRGEAVTPRYEMKFITKAGEERIGDFGASFIKYEGQPAMIASISDITDRKKNEEQLRSSEGRYRGIIENIEDGYFEVNLAGDITYASEPCLKIAGTDRETMNGMSFRQFSPKENWPKIYQGFYKVFQTGEPIKGLDWDVIRLDGSREHIDVSVSLIRDTSGKAVGFRGIVRDVTERKLTEEKIQWMAYHDILTGLPNRTLFYDRVDMMLVQAKRKQCRFSLMMLDLNRFKEVNDNFGHDVGDQLLVGVANRLKQVLREVDTVARIGGDEFVILLPEVADEIDTTLVGERIIDAFRQPIAIGERELTASFSIGMAVYPDDGDDMDSLIRHADQLMYHIKVRGGGLAPR